VIHAAALRAAGLPGTYSALDVDQTGLEQAFTDLRSGDLDGANVTMPHKQPAAELCDEVTPVARRAFAVNTLVRVGDTIVGHNTDVAGIRDAWDRAGLPGAAPVLILGNGGAAAAALLALEGREVLVSSRRPGAAAQLAARVDVRAREAAWGTGVPDAVVVNATPLGMHGEALPETIGSGASGLFDMAYGAGSTAAVREFRERGLPVAEGADMLIAQGAESFRLWTGRVADVPAMRRALLNRLDEIRGGPAPGI
jgi:shikimate dehydrogenase